MMYLANNKRDAWKINKQKPNNKSKGRIITDNSLTEWMHKKSGQNRKRSYYLH